MGNYQPFFSISGEHAFFSAIQCMGLNFLPAPQTTAVIEKSGLLTRNVGHGINVFYDAHRADALRMLAADTAEPFCLGFRVFSKSRLFKIQTESFSADNDSILYFDNRRAKKDSGGKLRLHDQEFVSDSDFKKLDSGMVEPLLSAKDAVVRPEFLVNIFVGDLVNKFFSKRAKSTFNHYFVKFRARQTYWKYYFLGDIINSDLYISDLENATQFEFSGKEILAGNRIALTFRSTKPIPLQEKSELRLQLRAKSSNGDKVFVKRLPVACGDQINRESIDGNEETVSEIYVNG